MQRHVQFSMSKTFTEENRVFPHDQMCLCMCAGYAQPGVTEDDILLELVMFMGVVCDEVTAPQLVQTGLVGLLSALQPMAVVSCCLHWLYAS